MLFFKSDAKLQALKILCKFFQRNFQNKFLYRKKQPKSRAFGRLFARFLNKFLVFNKKISLFGKNPPFWPGDRPHFCSIQNNNIAP